jgi:hypothetical protein
MAGGLTMRRWFLSYNSQDSGLMQSLERALRQKEPDAKIFFALKSLRAGGLWLPDLARAIAEATAFVLLIGENGIGPWQVIEYYEALDRRVKEHDFPLILVLVEGQPALGLPFLRQLHWVISADPASEQSLARLLDAASGDGAPPGELWRHTAPYRGLYAMTESDADFCFGRGRETAEVIGALAAGANKLPILLGNSGVNKSSVAQAGVLASLMRQAWPDAAQTVGARATSFTFRQDPGPKNSLGSIRISMPNKAQVYMHDTPKKELFERDYRFLFAWLRARRRRVLAASGVGRALAVGPGGAAQ